MEPDTHSSVSNEPPMKPPVGLPPFLPPHLPSCSLPGGVLVTKDTHAVGLYVLENTDPTTDYRASRKDGVRRESYPRHQAKSSWLAFTLFSRSQSRDSWRIKYLPLLIQGIGLFLTGETPVFPTWLPQRTESGSPLCKELDSVLSSGALWQPLPSFGLTAGS